MLRKVLLFFVYLTLGSCIDRLYFDPEGVDAGMLVVDGMITDKPGPYTIRLFRSSGAADNLNLSSPYNAKEVIIFDDQGNSEKLLSRGGGVFETAADGIRGVVGREYAIRIEGYDGTTYESIPDKMYPSGGIDSVYYEWESYKPLQGPTEYGFRVYMDAHDAGTQNFLRWRYTGTYKAETFPERHLRGGSCQGAIAPLPCSGVVIANISSGGIFYKTVGPCECCYCWVYDSEKKPTLNDDLYTDGTFKKVEVGYVPFNDWTFRHGKYMIKVEQMSLSARAYEFWKIIRDQKEGINSLFQPAFGKTKSNIRAINNNKEAIGFFSAASTDEKVIFITAFDAELPVPPPDIDPPSNCFLWDACDKVFENAFLQPPPEWVD